MALVRTDDSQELSASITLMMEFLRNVSSYESHTA
jgi:hypothetical protein